MEPYQKLEKEYAQFVGSTYAVSCSSGTAALHLALDALNVGPGDEVILPDFTMAACGFAVSYTGATPVFVDVDPDTYGVDPMALEKAITKKTKAIMVVHIYGRLADMKSITAIARKHHVPVVEDACEAHGAIYKSKADMSVYSFYGNKIIHAEEGGIVITNNKRLAKRVSYLKNMAFSPAHDYFHKEVGYNYRIANAEATLVLQSMKAYKANATKRRLIESWYSKYLDRPMPMHQAVWFYEANVPEKARAAILKKVPRARNCFKPLSSFPMYGGKKGKPNALKLSKSLILLPASPELTEAEVKKMSAIVNSESKKAER